MRLDPSRLIAAVLVAITCGPLLADGQNKSLTTRERAAAISRASLWSATDVESMDLKQGPQAKGAIAPMADVTCNYVDHKESGASRKFSCELEPGDVVKVKYGETNGEVYGVV